MEKSVNKKRFGDHELVMLLKKLNRIREEDKDMYQGQIQDYISLSRIPWDKLEHIDKLVDDQIANMESVPLFPKLQSISPEKNWCDECENGSVCCTCP